MIVALEMRFQRALRRRNDELFGSMVGRKGLNHLLEAFGDLVRTFHVWLAERERSGFVLTREGKLSTVHATSGSLMLCVRVERLA